MRRPEASTGARFRLCLRTMRIDFTKMHGVGNDFVVFDAPADESVLRPELLRALGDRRTGIGFDQALMLERPRRADTAVFYRIFNSDGSEAGACGNGSRRRQRRCVTGHPIPIRLGRALRQPQPPGPSRMRDRTDRHFGKERPTDHSGEYSRAERYPYTCRPRAISPATALLAALRY